MVKCRPTDIFSISSYLLKCPWIHDMTNTPITYALKALIELPHPHCEFFLLMTLRIFESVCILEAFCSVGWIPVLFLICTHPLNVCCVVSPPAPRHCAGSDGAQGQMKGRRGASWKSHTTFPTGSKHLMHVLCITYHMNRGRWADLPDLGLQQSYAHTRTHTVQMYCCCH